MKKDKVRLKFFGGKGGVGICKYELRRGKARGPALGGDGGHGSDVVIKATLDSFDLGFIKSRHIRGANGKNGKASGSDGRNGRAYQFMVPLGTIIYELKVRDVVNEFGALERKVDRKKVYSLFNKGDEYTVVKGGRGG